MTGPSDRLSLALADRYRLDRKVAVKVLKPDLAAVLAAERFLAEIKVTARLWSWLKGFMQWLRRPAWSGWPFSCSPNKKWLRNALFRSMFEVDAPTPGGLYLGRVGGQNVDAARIRSMVERITRGLSWEKRGTVLPSDSGIEVPIDAERQPNIREVMGRYFGGRPVRSIGSGVFPYVWNAASDDPLSTVWALDFYHAALFLVIAVNPNGPAAAAREEQ